MLPVLASNGGAVFDRTAEGLTGASSEESDQADPCRALSFITPNAIPNATSGDVVAGWNSSGCAGDARVRNDSFDDDCECFPDWAGPNGDPGLNGDDLGPEEGLKFDIAAGDSGGHCEGITGISCGAHTLGLMPCEDKGAAVQEGPTFCCMTCLSGDLSGIGGVCEVCTPWGPSPLVGLLLSYFGSKLGVAGKKSSLGGRGGRLGGCGARLGSSNDGNVSLTFSRGERAWLSGRGRRSSIVRGLCAA